MVHNALGTMLLRHPPTPLDTNPGGDHHGDCLYSPLYRGAGGGSTPLPPGHVMPVTSSSSTAQHLSAAPMDWPLSMAAGLPDGFSPHAIAQAAAAAAALAQQQHTLFSPHLEQLPPPVQADRDWTSSSSPTSTCVASTAPGAAGGATGYARLDPRHHPRHHHHHQHHHQQHHQHHHPSSRLHPRAPHPAFMSPRKVSLRTGAFLENVTS